MSNKKQSGANSALIATIIVAAAALIAVVVLLVILFGKNGQNEGSSNNFHATQELLDECGVSAHDLVAKNYDIIKLYVSEGLAHKEEPYGNEPEDGVYTVDSEEYTSIEDIEELVGSVYVAEEADRILHNLEVTTADGTSEKLEVYKTRDVFGDKFLGVDARFAPDENYTSDWSSCLVEVVPTSESSCDVTVYIDGITVEQASEHPESVLTVQMVKQDGEWRLLNFLK